MPVKPMNIAPGSSFFMASCILPDCVRCASSTKTKRLPLGAKSFGTCSRSSRMNSSVGLARRHASLSEPRNLWMSEQISHSCDLLSVSSRSVPLLVR